MSDLEFLWNEFPLANQKSSIFEFPNLNSQLEIESKRSIKLNAFPYLDFVQLNLIQTSLIDIATELRQAFATREVTIVVGEVGTGKSYLTRIMLKGLYQHIEKIDLKQFSEKALAKNELDKIDCFIFSNFDISSKAHVKVIKQFQEKKIIIHLSSQDFELKKEQFKNIFDSKFYFVILKTVNAILKDYSPELFFTELFVSQKLNFKIDQMAWKLILESTYPNNWWDINELCHLLRLIMDQNAEELNTEGGINLELATITVDDLNMLKSEKSDLLFTILPEHGIDLRKYLNDIEKKFVDLALEKTKQNRFAAAKLLKMKRTTLIEKIKKWHK